MFSLSQTICLQHISCVIKIISLIVSTDLKWCLQSKLLTILFYFVFLEKEYCIQKNKGKKTTTTKKSKNKNQKITEHVQSVSQSDPQATVPTKLMPWCASQSKGTTPFSSLCLFQLVNWFLTEETVTESCKWSRKSTFDWRAAWEFVSRAKLKLIRLAEN